MSSNHANEVTEGKSERPLWMALLRKSGSTSVAPAGLVA